MMQITRAADYALRAVTYVADQGVNRCVPASEISDVQEIPRVFVSRILQALARAKIMVTVPGRNGGARLVRAPKDISVLDVIEAIEGSVSLNRCLIRKGLCSRDDVCQIHPFWVEAREKLVTVLSKAKISQFVKSTGSPKPVRKKHK